MDSKYHRLLEKRTQRELKALPDRRAPASLVDQVLGVIRLEETAHRELRRLPDLAAPLALIPRVLEAIAAQGGLAWWRRPLLQWPRTCQVPVLAMAWLLLIGLIWGGFVVQENIVGHWLAQQFSQWRGVLAPLFQIGNTLVRAGAIVAQNSQPALFIGAGLLLATYFWCIGLGTACYRILRAGQRMDR